MITSYALHGDFIESCDCFDLCPCWVDDDPDEDHCTGLVVWKLGDDSVIDGANVSGAVVAAVTGHSGGRRTLGALTVLYVDTTVCGDEHFDVLADAFIGTEQAGNGNGRRTIDGPLGALAKVTGTVLTSAQRADIGFPRKNDTNWMLTVKPHTEGGKCSTEEAVRATGKPRTFPDDPANPPDGSHTPLKLLGTALHAELQIQDTADAQSTTQLSVRVPALPSGYLEVKARSGMRGTFAYEHPAKLAKKSGRGRKNAGPTPAPTS